MTIFLMNDGTWRGPTEEECRLHMEREERLYQNSRLLDRLVNHKPRVYQRLIRQIAHTFDFASLTPTQIEQQVKALRATAGRS